MTIYEQVEALLAYGLKTKLIQPEDALYTANRVFEYLNIEGVAMNIEGASLRVKGAALSADDNASQETPDHLETADAILDGILDWALETGKVESKAADYADIFDAGLMNCLMGRPSEVINRFEQLKAADPVAATDYFYKMGVHSNYIRMGRIQNNIIWQAETAYGAMDITVNLSKPEKDPKAIAAALSAPKTDGEVYPICLLCCENEGYRGRLDHPARQNLRLVPVLLNGESWRLQYSPYAYYNEHCIVLSEDHVPMKLTEATLKRLVDFVDQFPHYFVGSNADLPIVGGSILTHDHFQGGRYEFAMTRAVCEKDYVLNGFEDLKVSRVNWPMSVLRISGASKARVVEAAMQVYRTWQVYSDPAAEILSHTGDVPHNTITPIARRRGTHFEMDVVLRNNRTSETYPDGIFHPHAELHHIKKENIGLIEVMGLAVLPGRLATELDTLAEQLAAGKDWSTDMANLNHHREWYETVLAAHGGGMLKAAAWEVIQKEVGLKFMQVLEHAGVFKRDEAGLAAFDKFVEQLL